MANDAYPGDRADDKVDTLEFTSVRIHELALQRWLYQSFPIQDGAYPTPVVFATPKDAHSEFARLFKAGNNPFAYLLKATDSRGNPVYNPHPSNVFYPLLNVKRLNWRYRASQSYAYHRNRRIYYPTAEQHAGQVVLNDLANAASTMMPSAWDFRFQIDYFCKNPQTMSTFVNRLQRKLWAGGGTPQMFIIARYPFPHGPQYLRMFLESDIDNVTQEGDNENNQELRVSFVVCIEGYAVDFKTVFSPVLWEIGLAKERVPLAQDDLDRYFDFNATFAGLDDVRVGQTNPAIDSRPGLPPAN